MSAQTVRAAAPQHQILLREKVGSIAVLTLNRPNARNSLSEGLIAELHAALNEIRDDKSVRGVVIAANGPAFSAGHDMKELAARRSDADRGRAYFKQLMDACAAMMQAIVHLPKPVIACVQGPASAAGCQLVASCDLAVAADTATFCTPGVNIGLFCSTPMVALSRNVSRKRAMEMLLLGDMLSAKDAVDYGLINKVVAANQLLPEALSLAAKIAQKSPLTVAMGKAAFYAQAEMPLKDAYAFAAKVMVDNMMARDAEEGISAFLDKRKPEWKGS